MNQATSVVIAHVNLTPFVPLQDFIVYCAGRYNCMILPSSQRLSNGQYGKLSDMLCGIQPGCRAREREGEHAHCQAGMAAETDGSSPQQKAD